LYARPTSVKDDKAQPQFALVDSSHTTMQAALFLPLHTLHSTTTLFTHHSQRIKDEKNHSLVSHAIFVTQRHTCTDYPQSTCTYLTAPAHAAHNQQLQQLLTRTALRATLTLPLYITPAHSAHIIYNSKIFLPTPCGPHLLCHSTLHLHTQPT